MKREKVEKAGRKEWEGKNICVRAGATLNYCLRLVALES